MTGRDELRAPFLINSNTIPQRQRRAFFAAERHRAGSAPAPEDFRASVADWMMWGPDDAGPPTWRSSARPLNSFRNTHPRPVPEQVTCNRRWPSRRMGAHQIGDRARARPPGLSRARRAEVRRGTLALDLAEQPSVRDPEPEPVRP